MEKAACAAVRNGELEVLPKQFEDTWFRWLEKSRSWCISRQLWWGHRVPAWYVTLKDDDLKDCGAYKDHWIVGREPEEANRLLLTSIVTRSTSCGKIQTYLILGSHQVLLHAMIRDAYGRKMSKSPGSVIDPLRIIDGIPLEELHKSSESGNLDPAEVKRAKARQKADYPNGIVECGPDAVQFLT